MVYSVAAVYPRDPSMDCIEMLSKSPAKKARKDRKLVKVDIDLLVEKLKKAKVSGSKIRKVVSFI